MSEKDDKANFEAAVQAEVAKQMAAIQEQFAQTMQQAMMASLGTVDQASQNLEKERAALQQELDAALEARRKAEREGEKMAEEFFLERQTERVEKIRTEHLRELTLKQLNAGRTVEDICAWLAVTPEFVEPIRAFAERAAVIRQKEIAGQPRIKLPGNPRLRYDNKGRGGTIWFENDETRFSMWWEFGGGNALAMINIPTVKNWESYTGLPLDRRDDILQFIGEQVVADQTSGRGVFMIWQDEMTIYT
jgi:hypothetical protein